MTKTNKNVSDSEKSDNEQLLHLITKYTKNYIEYKESANLSKNSINNIKIVLEHFYTFVANEIIENEYLTMFDINRYFLHNYLNYLTKLEINKNTQKLHLNIVKNFLSSIFDDDLEKYSKLKVGITGTKIKTEQKEKSSFTQTEQAKLTNYIEKLDNTKTFLAQRNALLLKLLLYTGARISELINLKWPDIVEHDDSQHGCLYSILLFGKGRKERFSYILFDVIDKNIQFLKKYNHIYVFTSTQGNQSNRGHTRIRKLSYAKELSNP